MKMYLGRDTRSATNGMREHTQLLDIRHAELKVKDTISLWTISFHRQDLLTIY